MASMDARIILAGQQPDILGAMDRGRMAAEGQINLNRQNALAALYQEQGPGIMSGDQNALNALAQFDPNAALGVQSAQLGMESTRLGMDQTRQQMSALDAQTKRAAEEHARTLSREEAAREAAAIEAGVKQALMAPTPEAFDALMIQNGQPELVGQFENRQMLASQFMSVAEILKMNEPATPQSGAGKLKADLDAGLITPAQFEAEMARAAPKGTRLTFDPTTNTMTFEEGAGVTGGGEATVGQVYNPNEVANVVSMIDQIADDPNLDRVVGSLEGGGGNNVDDLNVAQRAYYGGDGLAVIERIGQLQSNAWLSARQMLKGGGAITDYESRKAEAAVARLSRAKSEAEFRTALKDLRDAITDGEAKLRGKPGATAPAAAPAPAATAAPPPSFINDPGMIAEAAKVGVSVEELWNMLDPKAQEILAASTAGGAPGGDVSDDDLLRMYGGE
jgi:hypothetical protein